MSTTIASPFAFQTDPYTIAACAPHVTGAQSHTYLQAFTSDMLPLDRPYEGEDVDGLDVVKFGETQPSVSYCVLFMWWTGDGQCGYGSCFLGAGCSAQVRQIWRSVTDLSSPMHSSDIPRTQYVGGCLSANHSPRRFCHGAGFFCYACFPHRSRRLREAMEKARVACSTAKPADAAVVRKASKTNHKPRALPAARSNRHLDGTALGDELARQRIAIANEVDASNGRV